MGNFNWVDLPFQFSSWGIAAVLALFALFIVGATAWTAKKHGPIAAAILFVALIFVSWLMSNVDQGSGLLQNGAGEMSQMEQFGGGAPRQAPAGE